MLLILLFAVALAITQLPSYPSHYSITGLFQIPDAFPNAIAEPLAFWTDDAAQLQRVSFYGSLANYYMLVGRGVIAEDVVRVRQRVCMQSFDMTHAALLHFLPSRAEPWTFTARAAVRGIPAARFSLALETAFNYTNRYDFYVALNDSRTPLRFEMRGVNLFDQSHTDHYVFDFATYNETFSNTTAFALPASCRASDARTAFRATASVHARLGALVPPALRPEQCADDDENDATRDAHFHHFMLRHRRHYRSCAHLRARAAVFARNAALVRRHNRAGGRSRFTLDVHAHRSADLSNDEYTSLMLRRHGLASAAAAAAPPLSDSAADDADDSDDAPIDWVTRGAFGRIMDQGSCGSCFTFAAVQSLAGVQFVRHGGALEVYSAQNLLDCSWTGNASDPSHANLGCDGGESRLAYGYAARAQAGRVALAASYPYLAADGYCHAASPRVRFGRARIAGAASVRGEAALLAALRGVGPLACGIDASLDSFRFYRRGVYDDVRCSNATARLDHELTVVGSGVDGASGAPYWLLANSYSTEWGADGFMRLRRGDDNRCGIATQCTYAVIK